MKGMTLDEFKTRNTKLAEDFADKAFRMMRTNKSSFSEAVKQGGEGYPAYVARMNQDADFRRAIHDRAALGGIAPAETFARTVARIHVITGTPLDECQKLVRKVCPNLK